MAAVKCKAQFVKRKGFTTSARASTLTNMMSTTAKRLREHGIDTALSETEQILSHVLSVSRHQLYLHVDRELTPSQAQEVDQMVARRCRREPLQYILGNTEFYGLVIATTPVALIPRPETELLVEAVIKLAQKFSSPRILELGTGTGCMALAVAAHVPQAQIVATDISEDALLLARRNAERLRLSNRVDFLHKDMLTPNSLEEVGQQDIIFSNPPYVLKSERADLQAEIRDWEPEAALYVEGDGLKFYRAIARLAQRRLAPGGYVAVEMASQGVNYIADIFISNRLKVQEVVKDYNGHQRHLIVMKGYA